MAPCAFMFNRQGSVKVALEQGDDFDARLEKLVETAFEAEAEDFEQHDASDGVVEIEVCYPVVRWNTLVANVLSP